ncbi:MAG: M20 family metallo-hydrolase [Gemmatimonadales bacterium]
MDQGGRMDRRAMVRATGAALAAMGPGGSVLARAGLGPGSAAPDAWRVNGDRVNGWLADLSRFGANPEGGVSRVGFGEADRAARAWLVPIMRESGLEVSTDPAGNIIGRRPGSDPALKPLLFGSHIDSVLHGGNYDGDVGTLAAVEVARTLNEAGYRNRHPFWVTMWADEESGLTGSRGFLGDIGAEELARPDPRDGVTLAEKIRRVGGNPEAMARYRNEPGSIAGYVELHIEQGGILDESGTDIGVVEGIVGIRSWNIVVSGFANHAGTTPMPGRKNALLAASELALAVDRIVKTRPGRQVGTVGRFEVRPGASNVIPGEVSMSIEIRDLSMATLDALWMEIERAGTEIMASRGTTWTVQPKATNVAALSTPAVRDRIADAARSLGLSARVMPSGAGHDAQDLARIGPMGMIFVPSVGGISHAPKEFTRPADVTNGANVLLQTMLRLDSQP